MELARILVLYIWMFFNNGWIEIAPSNAQQKGGNTSEVGVPYNVQVVAYGGPNYLYVDGTYGPASVDLLDFETTYSIDPRTKLIAFAAQTRAYDVTFGVQINGDDFTFTDVTRFSWRCVTSLPAADVSARSWTDAYYDDNAWPLAVQVTHKRSETGYMHRIWSTDQYPVPTEHAQVYCRLKLVGGIDDCLHTSRCDSGQLVTSTASSTTSKPKDDSNFKAKVIGLSVSFSIIFCVLLGLIIYYIVFKRRGTPEPTPKKGDGAGMVFRRPEAPAAEATIGFTPGTAAGYKQPDGGATVENDPSSHNYLVLMDANLNEDGYLRPVNQVTEGGYEIPRPSPQSPMDRPKLPTPEFAPRNRHQLSASVSTDDTRGYMMMRGTNEGTGEYVEPGRNNAGYTNPGQSSSANLGAEIGDTYEHLP